MKKKQLLSIIIAGAVIMAVGITGIASNVISKKLIGDSEKKQEIFDTTFSSLWGAKEGIELPEKDFVGVINIVGEISSNVSRSSQDSYNHSLYMDYIEEMEESDYNKGIMLYVNTPGGGVYESDELYLKLMEYKEKTKRPVWAYFASEACSGGYYISMAADKIYANRNCWTGSIGVIVSLLNCKDLYDKLGIKQINIASGKNKAMGAAGDKLTDEQRDILQGLVDEAYDQFVDIVCQGRNLDDGTVRALADGRIYSAKQAKEKQLIDEIDSYENEKKEFTKQLGCAEDITFYAPSSGASEWFSTIFGAIEKIMPKSDIQLATDIVENKGSGVLKYYAE